MRPISVLFTNNTLGPRGGSETYVLDVAMALLARGHRPVAFSVVHGDVAHELRGATVPVIDDLTRLAQPPDVIHGHHHLETLIAALAFPDTPIVNFCHGWVPWEEMPLHHPSVRRYVGVDEVCLDRLVSEEGIAPGRVELLLNFVDLTRFPRRKSLPERPLRALVLSNAARASGYPMAIRPACEAAGIELDIVGAAAGNATARPGALLGQYDLVFAKGRTAIEALAAGCAVILADTAGAGPLVTPDNYQRLRRRNFGIRELRHPHHTAWYSDQLAGYDAHRAAQVTDRIRVDADQQPAIDRLLEIYETAMNMPAGSDDPLQAASRHCRRIASPLKQAHGLWERVTYLETELALRNSEAKAGGEPHGDEHAAALFAKQAAETQALQARVEALLQDLVRLEAEGRAAQVRQAMNERAIEDRLSDLRAEQSRGAETARQLAAARREVESLQHQVAAFHALPTLRLRDAILRTPFGPALQRMARRLGTQG